MESKLERIMDLMDDAWNNGYDCAAPMSGTKSKVKDIKSAIAAILADDVIVVDGVEWEANCCEWIGRYVDRSAIVNKRRDNDYPWYSGIQSDENGYEGIAVTSQGEERCLNSALSAATAAIKEGK
jgi:hypothetical protein